MNFKYVTNATTKMNKLRRVLTFSFSFIIKTSRVLNVTRSYKNDLNMLPKFVTGREKLREYNKPTNIMFYFFI